MFGLDAFHLARIQFAFTVSFHIIFPAITIGLASYLAVLEGLWLKTKNPVWRSLYHFWSKIFAVNFGMGVVSGLVMAYQFGTNWSEFSRFAGGVTGPLLTYEVLTAFFLEAGFLGVMLFGMQGSLKFVDNFGIQILIYVMLAWGLNIVVGLAGLLDLGGVGDFLHLGFHGLLLQFLCQFVADIVQRRIGRRAGFRNQDQVIAEVGLDRLADFV